MVTVFFPYSIYPGVVRTLFVAFYVVLFTVLGGKFHTGYLASAEYAVSYGLTSDVIQWDGITYWS